MAKKILSFEEYQVQLKAEQDNVDTTEEVENEECPCGEDEEGNCLECDEATEAPEEEEDEIETEDEEDDDDDDDDGEDSIEEAPLNTKSGGGMKLKFTMPHKQE